MTNKELQKLGRRELLQLLLDQAKETERLGKLLKENDEQLKQLEEGYERLRDRLDKKDAQIHQLKDELKAEKEKAEMAPRFGGGFDPAQQMAEQYLRRVQGYYPMPGGAAASAPPETGGARPGFQAPQPYSSQAPESGGYPYQAQSQDPFPYQAPAQGQEAYSYSSQTPDPFPYQVPRQEGPAGEPYSPAMEAQYQYPSPRPERRRQGGQRGKMPFRLKKDQENGKTTLFFGWQHN